MHRDDDSINRYWICVVSITASSFVANAATSKNFERKATKYGSLSSFCFLNEPTMERAHAHHLYLYLFEAFDWGIRREFFFVFFFSECLHALSIEPRYWHRLDRQHIITFWCDECINVILIIHRRFSVHKCTT